MSAHPLPSSRSLAARYESLGVKLNAPGDWPVLIEPWAPTRATGLTRIIPQPPGIDRELRAQGEAYLERRIQHGFKAWDGGGLALNDIRPGLITLRPTSYLTSLYSSELLVQEWEAGGETPLRDRIEQRCDRDPLRNGAGRSSMVAVSCLLVWDGPEGPEFVLGRRRDTLAILPGAWHVCPAGGLEADLPALLSDSIAMEVREEVLMNGLEAERMVSGATVLGIAFDLLRLRAEICCLLRCSGERPRLDEAEHSEAMWRTFTDQSLKDTLAEITPERFVPVGAGALELARWRLQTLS